MRCCTRCKESKPLGEFYKTAKRIASWCRSCFNTYSVKRWQDKKVAMVKRMGGKCRDCGVTYNRRNIVIFDLHHTTGTDDKVGDWTKMRMMSESRLSNELAKCVLLCANCHRIRHSKGVEGVRVGRKRKEA